MHFAARLTGCLSLQWKLNARKKLFGHKSHLVPFLFWIYLQIAFLQIILELEDSHGLFGGS